MEQPLILSIIDYVVLYGPQAFGIIVIIILSKVFIQGILWVLSRLVFLFLWIGKVFLNLLYVLLTLIPGDKLDRTIFRIESTIRDMGDQNNSVKKWFMGAPRKYERVHRNLMIGIRSIIGLGVAAVAVILVYSVFIEESLSMEQVLNHIGYVIKSAG